MVARPDYHISLFTAVHKPQHLPVLHRSALLNLQGIVQPL